MKGVRSPSLSYEKMMSRSKRSARRAVRAWWRGGMSRSASERLT